MDVRPVTETQAAPRTEPMIRPVELFEGVVTPRLLERLRTYEASPGALSAYVNIDMKKWGGRRSRQNRRKKRLSGSAS